MIRPVEKIDNLVPIKTALISVYDKSGLDVLILALITRCPGIKIISSGGTYSAIKQMLSEEAAAAHLVEVSEYTGQPETEGGLVKTLHHKLFLGYLTETYCPAHQEDLKRENARPVDLVVINLYPFQEVVAKKPKFEDARGNIDVGGPSALRAAAKNFHRVMTLTDPYSYNPFIQQLEFFKKGRTDLRQRFIAACLTFRALSEYDTAIYNYLRETMPSTVEESYEIIKLAE
jgi:phosphoribosylaminoimidazolecarboxamide formyltransferase/IMP cyclohydrolase